MCLENKQAGNGESARGRKFLFAVASHTVQVAREGGRRSEVLKKKVLKKCKKYQNCARMCQKVSKNTKSTKIVSECTKKCQNVSKLY